MAFFFSSPFFTGLSFVLGLCFGSFYNVCIHRIISGQSIVFPASHCPKCGHSLSWWENIPLLSFVLLKGRCWQCQKKISLLYPLVEAITGLWGLALALNFGPGLPWLIYFLFGGVFIVLSFIDLKTFYLPDILTLPGGILALLLAPTCLGLSWQDALIGAGAGAGSFWVLQQAYRIIKGIEGLGTGDIKLMFLIGALLGWQALPLVIFIGAVSGLGASLVWMLIDKLEDKKRNALPKSPEQEMKTAEARKTEVKNDLDFSQGQGLQTAIPFGPFLSLGAMLYILWGPMFWLYLQG